MKKQNGFTLMEVVVVLVLVGILAAMAGSGLVYGVRGYLIASENADITQKAQLALTRLSKEIHVCFDCDGSAGSIGFPFTFNSIIGERTLDFNSDAISINGSTLVDQVSSFTLNREAEGPIMVSLVMAHQSGGATIPFQTKVFPRNIFK